MVNCKICGGSAVPCLLDRPDYEYEVPQKLAYNRCLSCSLVFASPSPTSQEVKGFYKQYSTHKQARQTVIGKLERWATLRETRRSIGNDKDLRILDYGCGNGSFLKELRAAGYRKLLGYDFDTSAVAATRLIGIEATADIEMIAGPYDVITLNHVIEHLVDPVEELKRLVTKLAPGGRVVIRTPNNLSLMARLTGDSWRGWETPRHLNIMNKLCLPKFIEQAGLEMEHCYNSKAMFFGIFHESLRGAHWATRRGRLVRHATAFLFWPWPSGEETVAVARKHA